MTEHDKLIKQVQDADGQCEKRLALSTNGRNAWLTVNGSQATPLRDTDEQGYYKLQTDLLIVSNVINILKDVA